jgi:hypothetical protein
MTLALAVEQEVDVVLAEVDDVPGRVAMQLREAEGEEQALQLAQVGATELREGDPANAAGVGGGVHSMLLVWQGRRRGRLD